MASKINALGHYIPKNKIENNYFIDKLNLDTSDKWITERTGIKTRYFVDPKTSSSDIGTKAAQMCLDNSNIKAENIDLIIVATATPDHLGFPSTASIIQQKLGCNTTPAFDISAACTGFCFGLTTAESFLLNPNYNHILVIGVDCLSKITDMQDRGTCILFADGAGAAIISKTTNTESSILYSKIYTDGKLANVLSLPDGGSKNPLSKDILEKRSHYIQMNGKTVFKTAINYIVPAIKEAMASLSIDISEISYLICHQANVRILQVIKEQLNLTDEKIISNIQHYGNTSAASIPLAMSEHHQKKPFKKGDIIVLAGFGAGFTWGVTVLKW